MTSASNGPPEGLVESAPAVLLYFSGTDCGVCHALWPRVESLLRDDFPRVRWRRINVQDERELAARHGVFAVPTLICYFEGREGVRLVRTFGLQQLRDALERPYRILFPDP